MATNNSKSPNDKKRRHRPTRMSAEEVKTIIPDFRKTKATLAQARFAACYISNGFNGPQAYKDAVSPNVKDSTASNKASAWLRNPNVMDCVAMYTEAWLGEIRNKLEGDIIRVLMAQAFYDPSIFYTPEGEVAFKDWDQIPQEQRCCVVSIKTRYYGKDADRIVTEITLVDRHKALGQLAQYISLMNGANSQIGLNLTEETELFLKQMFSKASPALSSLRQMPTTGPDSEDGKGKTIPFARGAS